MEDQDVIIELELLEYWVGLAPGAFHVSDLSRHKDNQQIYIDRLEILVERGILERYGDKRGWYQPRKTRLEEIDYVNVGASYVDIWLPFGLSDAVEIHSGNVIIVSGAPNSGKTAIMLNVIKENRGKDWDIFYFSSEMGATELNKRLRKFPDISIDQWGFKAYHRSGDFHEVVKPGTNSLNIIDFLEIHDKFYKVGECIKKIHDNLDGAIAFICLQKNPGQDTGLGGYRTMEVARLVLALDHGRVKVTKAKNFMDPEWNPNGRVRDFKLVNGCQIVDRYGWYREKDNDVDRST
jgi:hypothetical protein